MSNALKDYLSFCQNRVERALEARLPSENQIPTKLHEAMRYCVLDGGKRMRPMLTYCTGKAVGIAPEDLDGAACAVEFIHVYSLIHDDLPAMDDDDLRRGKPTCHIAYDEATAILTGDALQALAFKVLADDPTIRADAESRLKMITLLAKASGSQGMVGGQAIDLESVGTMLTLPQLENMHIHKTGALIRASVNMATLTRPDIDPKQAEGLDHYAKCIGLSFQVKDDILDEESDTATLGKTQGKDKDNDKPTYPALLGLAGAKQKAQELHEQAIESLNGFGPEADLLRDLSLYIIQRDH
ncbi:(2E,6E)-farnesyl diphosphate synthase [Methylotuvimicrobium alcaliphilum]|uniref:Geranyltranstransferase (Farnesyl-diphosphate synthase) (FPP synthase) n=1 Tax=Methylotuvimicrobium alcaliphilum (strain DSM 19304 / NCIMB 14124 / VKM B-2133 / 20Z) TaxID=1091494 RepID=G4T2M6_META2|nr:farnesyl diphosphate synthase [Methylotuvimicrobium alcaliphilum]CCE24755.1 Geranyltranstransferase (Farnesyl-diphosphate synthase) (FPP synthase) [Methylotuvimicrobium alcaliphilum 20Z]